MVKQHILLFRHQSKLSLALSAISLVFMSASFQTMASDNCHHLVGCEKKYCEINQQLDIAKKYNNQNEVNGLTTALAQAKTHCNPAEFQEKLTKKITQAKKELADYDTKLITAESAGNKNKIQKYQNKIQEDENKIKQWEMELATLKQASKH
ncbi:DUF1090 domain-containing protein [uncultured Shewanella sp.]|uniref:DUF1090 domain-containing protein n=1 Tax=uncultured Shewanella sp. TaxID=173975 RepID=UPI002622FA03|nr:DUF1090 domain-containing protein [uncultured Shewanella sp.]